MAKKVKKTANQAAVPDKTAKKKSASGKTVKNGTNTGRKKSTNKTANKAVTQKSSGSNPNTMKTSIRRKSTLSKAELSHFHDLLVEKLKEIMGDVDHIESEALKKSRLDASGDLSSMPIHMADIGSDNYEQEFSLGLMDSERKIVHEIHDALKRIENGTYGICEGTGEPIPKSRLEGIPWARYCVEYAQRMEKGLTGEGERWYDSSEDAGDEDDGGIPEEEESLEEEEEYVAEKDADDEKETLLYGYDEEEDDKDGNELA